jgi:hypothetical protein
MDKENVVYVHNGILFSHKEKYYVICRRMNETEDHHVKHNARLRKTNTTFSLLCGI